MIEKLINDIELNYGYGVIIRKVFTPKFSLWGANSGNKNPNGYEVVEQVLKSGEIRILHKIPNKPNEKEGLYFIDICRGNSTSVNQSKFAVYNKSIELGLKELISNLDKMI